MEKKIIIEEYFSKGIFVIPEYQRGYKWSVKEDIKESSLEHFVRSLIKAYGNNLNEYFIEAVTVVEENNQVILVDGQQRTTSLFLLFTFLKDFAFIKGKLIYKIREDSHKWLKNQISDQKEQMGDEDTQDIFYFKEATRQVNELIGDAERSKNNEVRKFTKEDFLRFIKENVYLLYNNILKEKAVNTFIALNGLKAIMKDEELIKSDLLIKSSRIEKTINKQVNSVEAALNDLNELIGFEWKINEDRGRLARNWDRWLYWWNQKEVKEYFGTGNYHPLYYLLVTYWKINNKSEDKKTKDFSFDSFKNQFITNSKEANHHFEGLRKLQKTFEDLYNDYSSHNLLGLILKTSNSRENALHYFLDSKAESRLSLEEYAKWSLVGATHLEIINDIAEKVKNEETDKEEVVLFKMRKAEEAINLINEKYVYKDENNEDFKDSRKEYAYRFLMLLNLLEDNKLERKFDFSIWGNRSLEHIYPKSKSDELDFSKEEYIEGSVHCIGNLVLLYGSNNSAFGTKEFAEKKNTYFNTSESFQSRNLLHTMSVFAKSEWKEKEIIKNKESTINQLKNYYGIK